jgi:hypothetical protein
MNLNKQIEVDSELYAQLRRLLEQGIVHYDGSTVDFSTVQTITITQGKATFRPPIGFQTRVGPINVKTTISSASVKDGGIRIEIDNSPIDIEVKPNELVLVD